MKNKDFYFIAAAADGMHDERYAELLGLWCRASAKGRGYGSVLRIGELADSVIASMGCKK